MNSQMGLFRTNAETGDFLDINDALAQIAGFKDREVILQAQEWMEDNHAKGMFIDDIAEQVGMSSRNFKRRFKVATGESPVSYLQRLRIETAKDLLESTYNTVDEIAFKTGYESSNSLRKLFKKYTSLSPKSYREKFSRLA